MKLPRTAEALESCKAHLKASATLNTPVETYLVSYLLVVTYSELEDRIKAILAKRGAKSNDPYLERYLVGNHKHNTGKIRISNVTDLLARFGVDYRDSFVANVNNTSKHAAWDNIVINRHKVSHDTGVNMTILEFETAYVGCRETLLELAKAFSLTDTDIADLL